MWNTIIDLLDWFGELKERHSVIKSFNNASRRSFEKWIAPCVLKAKIVLGEPEYKHSFSKFLGSGFRIEVLTENTLSYSEKVEIGSVVINNTEFVRKLVYLGWDTLSVYGYKDSNGLNWHLIKFAKIGETRIGSGD